jgi:hypothetical protein
VTDPMQSVLQTVAAPSPVATTSRYFGIEVAQLETASGDLLVYLRRRFVPPAERFELLVEVPIVQGDRLDNLTAKYLGDPEQFWRLCDANNALQPAELTDTVGRRIRITMPEGIPGPRSA